MCSQGSLRLEALLQEPLDKATKTERMLMCMSHDHQIKVGEPEPKRESPERSERKAAFDKNSKTMRIEDHWGRSKMC